MTTKPRRWTGRLLLVADLVVANAVAGIWVATFLQPRVLGADPGPGGEAIEGRRSVLLPLDTPAAWLAFAGGVLLLVCNFAWLVRPRARGLPSHWVLSETAAGPVRVAREAIENALRVRGEALAEVTRVRVHVDQSAHKRVVVTAQFLCAEGQDHLAASQRLRQALRERFAELVRLGDARRAEFELEFQGFAGKLGKNVEPQPVEDPVPFTGPKYPIDDDSVAGGTT